DSDSEPPGPARDLFRFRDQLCSDFVIPHRSYGLSSSPRVSSVSTLSFSLASATKPPLFTQSRWGVAVSVRVEVRNVYSLMALASRLADRLAKDAAQP